MSNIIRDYKIDKVKELLPNRYPFLLVDYISEIIPGVSSKTYKNLSANEWYFPAHFPNEPMLPGMVQMEALLQTLSLTVLSIEEYKGSVISVQSATNLRFRKKLIPGSRIYMEAILDSFDKNVAKGNAKGFVLGEEVCSGNFSFFVNIQRSL